MFGRIEDLKIEHLTFSIHSVVPLTSSNSVQIKCQESSTKMLGFVLHMYEKLATKTYGPKSVVSTFFGTQTCTNIASSTNVIALVLAVDRLKKGSRNCISVYIAVKLNAHIYIFIYTCM